jgi:c-di-GMP-binding flagellar brake protein YcgR
VRVKADIPFYYRMAGYPVDYYCAVGCDISGGGICIFSSHFIDVDTRLEMKIIFPEFRMEVIGQVRRCWMDKKTEAYKTGIEFEKIEEENQDKLVSFIFLKQREIIQKGIADSE